MRPIYLISQTPYPGVVHIPILQIRFFTPAIDFTNYTGIIFTSKQAVKSLENYPAIWKNLISVCVSESTAKAAQEAGACTIRIADGYGKSIPDLLAEEGRGGKWLYLRPKTVASEWTESAREKGVLIEEIVMYETVCAQGEEFPPIESNGVLIFTSPSSIECFTRRFDILPTHGVVVIGKTTQAGLPPGTNSVLSAYTSVASCLEKAREIAAFEE